MARVLRLMTLVLGLATLVPVARADFNAGLEAYQGKDYKAAIEAWEPLAADGDSAAQYNLGVIYQNALGVHRDLKRAAWYFREAAGRGHVKAMLNIGYCYAQGHGVGQSYQEALYWMRKAADAGDATARLNLGTMYYNGWGTDRNVEAAIAWTKLAADAGLKGAAERVDIMSGKKGEPPALLP
jgi:TPR repeat protein